MEESGKEFVVSQEFHGGGRWIVHVPGANRLCKVGYYTTKEDAQHVADILNAKVDGRNFADELLGMRRADTPFDAERRAFWREVYMDQMSGMRTASWTAEFADAALAEFDKRFK